MARTDAVSSALDPVARVEHPSVAERTERGRAARRECPRSCHAEVRAGERDAVQILRGQEATRVPELVPIRYGRMLTSEFAFFRGAAAVMAHDLANDPRSGLRVQLCGDAHLANFGGFASPERRLVFDLNDFDETLPGPFEWDVKRLAASVEIAARHRNLDGPRRTACVATVVESYREAMRQFAGMGALDVWYARLDVDDLRDELRRSATKRTQELETRLAKASAKALTKDSMKALGKLTDGGGPQGRRIISDPPLIVRFADLAASSDIPVERIEAELHRGFRAYRHTLQGDRRRLLERFRWVDIARKVVGVGSVGTRCFIMLLVGRDDDDPLFLQAKEAGPSVLEPYLGASEFANHGQRVVEGQRLVQAASDIFLGWVRMDITFDGRPRDFYFRQLWDWKASADLESIQPEGLLAYARACGWTLARAHARSGDAVAISAYMGKSAAFDGALQAYAAAYADQNAADYAAMQAAAAAGSLPVESGL
jgi:uncharacterized protein (DUF2252 family)